MNIILLDYEGKEIFDPQIKNMDRSYTTAIKVRITHLTHATAGDKIPLEDALIMAYLQGRLDVELDAEQCNPTVKFDS